MSSNPEVCSCGKCVEWRSIVKHVCKSRKLNYDKLSLSDKVTLYHWGVHTRADLQEHNWRIMSSRFEYAKLTSEDIVEDPPPPPTSNGTPIEEDWREQYYKWKANNQ